MRRFVILGFAVVFVLAGLAALAGGDVEAGKAVYNKKCATCHGKDGMAKPAMAKMFKVEMRHLGSPEVQAKSDERQPDGLSAHSEARVSSGGRGGRQQMLAQPPWSEPLR
jgi:mono/diheme cytochrome c family protein